MVPLELQFYTFSLMVLTGIVLGLAFDAYRVFRGVTGARGGILSHVGDLLFWAVATILVTIALWQGNWGELRLYVFLGLGLGLVIYYWLASRMVISLIAGFFRLSRRLGAFFARLLAVILRILLAIVLFPYRVLRYLWRWPARVIKGIAPGVTAGIREALARLLGSLIGRRITK